jgi:hypothetical protein
MPIKQNAGHLWSPGESLLENPPMDRDEILRRLLALGCNLASLGCDGSYENGTPLTEPQLQHVLEVLERRQAEGKLPQRNQP